MKKELFFIAGVAAIFAGCARETEVATPETGRKHITIQASLAPETKTTVEITNGNGVYSWAEEETIAVIESEASEVAQFTVSNAENGYFEGTIASGNTLLGAVSPESAITKVRASERDVVYSLEFSGSYSADQTNAILVAAAPKEIQSQDAQDPLYKFQFKHVGGLMKVTYANIPVGTKALRYTTNQNIVGVVADLASLTGVEVSTSDLDGGMTAVVNFATPVSTPNTTHVFYVPVPTGTYGSFEIALLDDAGTVIPGTLRSKTQNFTVARTDIIKIPTVTLPAATLTNEYVKVTSDDALTDGVYLIVNEESNVAFDGNLETLDVAENTVDVTITNGTIASSTEVDAATFTIDMTNGTILSHSGKYIGRNSNSNGLDSEESALTNSISIDKDGNADVVSAGKAYLRYNATSGDDRFRYYKSSTYTAQKAIQLFKSVSGSSTSLIDPALAFSQTSVSISAADYKNFVAPTLTNTYNVPVVWSSTDTNEDYALLDDNTGDVVLTGEPGTFTITASSAASSVFAASSASYTVTVTSSAPGYVKVTSAPADWSGQYLIVYETDNLAFDGSLTTLDAVGNSIAVTITNGKIESNETTNAAAFTIASVTGGYSIKSASGFYIGKTAKGNGMDTSKSDAFVNTLAYANSVVSITSSGGPVLKYNSASNQNRFRYYGSGQQDIQLYKLEDNRQNPGMSWSTANATASWDTGNVASGFTAPTLTAGNATGITYESTNTSVATVTAAGAVTIVGPGETVIKAIFAGNATYQPQTVSYSLTVTDNRDVVAAPVISPDASNTIAPGTQVTISCTTAGAAIHYTVDGTVPTSESAVYSTPITLTQSTTVKAIATKVGFKDSAVSTANYTVGAVNTSTEADPYTPAEAVQLAGQLAVNGTLANVYVSGIISEIVYPYDSQRNNVSFHISADGSTTGTQLLIFRAAASSSDDFKVGDAVEFKGTLKNYKSSNSQTTTPELDAGATLIYQVHAPVISPNGGTFNDSQSVTITADQGATIRYTDDGTDPTATSGTIYSGAFSVTATTTVKAVAIKDGHTTGVVDAMFTKNGGGYVDILTQSWTGVTGTSYASWNNKPGSASTAVYAGQSAAGNSSIQLRSTSNSGVVSTTSGGKVKKIVVTWNSNTSNGRTLNVYGKNSAYSSAADLYGNQTQGTLLGTIVYGTSTEITVSGDYEYIGFRSASGALYLSEVDITWGE